MRMTPRWKKSRMSPNKLSCSMCSFLLISKRLRQTRWLGLAMLALLCLAFSLFADNPSVNSSESPVLRVVSYNVENYLLMNRHVDGRWRRDYPKPEAEKNALRTVIRYHQPDILALQEMGEEAFLIELQADLRDEGLFYPYRVWMESNDGVRHLAVLSKVEPVDIQFHNDLDFPYRGERSRMRRGMLEVVFNTGLDHPQHWHLFVFHLKSKWTEFDDDPEANLFRAREAEAARNFIIEKLSPEDGSLYLIAGDLNDDPNSGAVRRFLTRGERIIGIALPNADDRGHVWTHFWARRSLYSVKDYLIPSPTMSEHVLGQRAYISSHPKSKDASDHRLVYIDLQITP
jgi:endonuclease/exonuclease/phosphatase family metal-dependent hydrolase